MSVQEYSFIAPLGDVGRYFKLAERTDLWFDYAPPSNASNRGTTDRRRRYYEKDSRFQILQHLHAVEASSTDGKAYEVLLVLPVDDDGDTLFDNSSIKIDADYLERVRLITDIPDVLIDQYSNIKDVIDQYSIPAEVAEALKGLKGNSYPDWIEFQEAIAGFLPDEDRDRIEESLTNTTQTGYIWSVYANKPYITLDLSPTQIEEIIQQYKYPKLYKGNTGINVVTLQIWLKMLGFYDGPTSGLLDEDTEDAVKRFCDDQDVPAPSDPLVVDWNTWEAMENILKQRLPPDPYGLERLPFPRRKEYDTEEKYQKALYEGLKRFGFPIPPADERVEFRLTTDANGIGRLTNVPPGKYDLTIESLNTNPITGPSGSAEIHLVDENGNPLSGTVVLSSPEGEFAVTVNSDGMGVMNGIPPGEYTLSVKDAKRGVDNGTSAGNVEVRLLDQAGQPVSAQILLSGDLGEPDAVQKAILLFKAIVRGVDLYENINGENRFPNILSEELDETRSNIEAWDNFSNTWGRFYGAPWAGVTFHSINDVEPGHEQGELNWIEFETISMLYEWGEAYLQASINEDDLKERLRRPIAIRHISKSLGGKIDQRADFSQVGTEASLHLPRKSEIVFEGIASGQTYGGIDYDSPEYSTSHLEKQLTAFMSINTDFRARCPDDDLISHFQPQEPFTLETGLVNDQYIKARQMNISINKMIEGSINAVARTARETRKDQMIKSLDRFRKYLGKKDDKFDFLGVDQTLYTWRDVENARLLFQQKPIDRYQSLAWRYIRQTQRALWWCKLLVRAGKLEEAQELSDHYIARGYEGEFRKFKEDISDGKIDKWIFSFNDNDWRNPFQLEALVEFYINYNDPWRPPILVPQGKVYAKGKNKPLLPIDKSYNDIDDMSKGLHLVLIDSFGARNNTTK